MMGWPTFTWVYVLMFFWNSFNLANDVNWPNWNGSDVVSINRLKIFLPWCLFFVSIFKSGQGFYLFSDINACIIAVFISIQAVFIQVFISIAQEFRNGIIHFHYASRSKPNKSYVIRHRPTFPVIHWLQTSVWNIYEIFSPGRASTAP